MELKFIADANVGKLARWLRIMGHDTAFFTGIADSKLVQIALNEDRVILTRDTQIMERKLIVNRKIKAVLIRGDLLPGQIRQVLSELGIVNSLNAFSRCIECNTILTPKSREKVKALVPIYVFQTQNNYMQCSECERVYWKGTHWQEMNKKMETFLTFYAR